MLGPEPSYEVTLDFPLSERQRLALYLVRHLGGLNVALLKNLFSGAFSSLFMLKDGVKARLSPRTYIN
jgi:hypothetical protein